MSIIKSTETITIFESPDGGKTVYARQSGASQRTMIRSDDKTSRWMNFRSILELADTEPTLNNILEQAEITYELLRDRTS